MKPIESIGKMTMSEVFAVPVRYIVLKALLGYRVADTSFEGNGRTVCGCKRLEDAHRICGLLNYIEGYEYPW
jgi:hypothetical protein